MLHRARVPSVLFLSLFVCLPAQTSPTSDPRLAEILRLPALQPEDWQALFSIAESGDPEAQYRLGTIYEYGKLLPLDMQKAAFWFQKSADQGYAPAEYFLCGQRAGSDNLEHERCLWRGAESGVPEAQFWLGVAFRDHLWFGVTDEVESLKWIRRAAEAGNVDAEEELGSRYEWGLGVEQDYSQAVLWLRRAAEHVPDRGGAGGARNELAILYESGEGVPQDYVQALMWYTLARVPENAAHIQLEMTPAQIAQANQLAADWRKQHPDPAIY
jgi:TPR repeat protein